MQVKGFGVQLGLQNALEILVTAATVIALRIGMAPIKIKVIKTLYAHHGIRVAADMIILASYNLTFRQFLPHIGRDYAQNIHLRAAISLPKS